MGGQAYVGLHEKGLLLLSHFNQRWSVSPLKERALYLKIQLVPRSKQAPPI